MNEEKQTIDLAVQKSKAVIINNQVDYENAVGMLKGIKDLRKKLNGRYMPMKKKTYEAYQLVMTNIKDYENPLSEAERTIRSSMSVYVSHKENERRIKEAEIRKEAEEKERAKIKIELEECGLEEKEAVKEAEKIDVVIPEVKIEDETKVERVSYRDNWKFTIKDISKIPVEYMMPDEKKLGAVVRALKGNTNITGIEVYSEKVLIIR